MRPSTADPDRPDTVAKTSIRLIMTDPVLRAEADRTSGRERAYNYSHGNVAPASCSKLPKGRPDSETRRAPENIDRPSGHFARRGCCCRVAGGYVSHHTLRPSVTPTVRRGTDSRSSA